MDTARAMFHRVLSQWTIDLLELRRRGEDRPACGSPSDGDGNAHDRRAA